MKIKTHSQFSTSLTAVSAAFTIAVSSVQADTLLTSTFEGSLGAWTASTGAALYTFTSGTNTAPVGNGAANLPKSSGTITLTDALPLGLRGHTSVTVAFRTTWLSGTTTRFLFVQYAADGVNFVNLAKVTSGNGATNAASSVTLNVGPSGANSVTVSNMTEDTTYTGAAFTDNAKFRFVNTASATADVRAFVDEIVITATPNFGGVYWDIDNTTAGSGGATPSGTWDATANWNPVADGTGTTAAWASGGKAVFSAGSDATGAYTVNVSGTQEISGLFFTNGTPTLTGGTALGMTAATRVFTSPGVSATIATPLTDVGGPWVMTKEGTGNLVLSGDNSLATGGMVLSGGRTQFDSAASINGTAKNVTVNAGSTVVFGSAFGAGNLPAGLDRIVGTSTGVIAADNYAASNLDFNTPALTAAYLGAVGSVNYTGTLTPQGTTYRLGGGGGSITMANTNATTGANALIIQGNVTLAGANDHSGVTTLNAGGNLTLGNDGSLGSGTFTIAGAGTVQALGTVVTTNPVAANSDFTVSGTGALTLGNLTLSANRTITNTNTTTSTTLGAISGATRNLTLAGNGNTTISGIIGTTTGALTKSGTGTLTLKGDNSYTGTTSLSGGVSSTIVADHANALGVGGNITYSGNGTLQYTANSAGTDWSTRFKNSTFGIGISTGGQNVTFAGIIDSTNTNGLFKYGSGGLTLSGANTYTGTTTIDQGGLVVGTNAPVSAAGALGNSNTEVALGTAGSGSFAQLYANGAFTVARSIRLRTSDTTDAGTRQLTIGGTTAHESVFSGNIFLGSTNQASKGIRLTAAAGGKATFSGVIQNPSGQAGAEITDAAALTTVTKVGDGTVVLSNTNTYTGGTAIAAGTLALGANDVLPNVSNVSIGTATLDADTRTDTAGTLDATGSAVINLGAGAAVAFADSDAVDWTGGTLNVTGTLGATSLRFGTDATGLSPAQLAVISVNGSGLGTYILDASGYLIPGGGGPGPLDHFAISAISSPQTVGTPITGITLTAQDASNATVTSFTGTVNFGGNGGFTGTSATFTAGVLSGVSVIPTNAGSGLTFTVTDIGTGKTGSATITTIQTQYDAWSGGLAFDVDTNNDGVDNGLAWMLGAANPSANAVGLLPTVSQSGGDLVMTFTCLKVAGRGTASLKLQHSKDLGNSDLWTVDEVSVPDAAGIAGTTDIINFTVPSVNGNAALVNLQAIIPASAAAPGTKLFGRLQAVKP